MNEAIKIVMRTSTNERALDCYIRPYFEFFFTHFLNKKIQLSIGRNFINVF